MSVNVLIVGAGGISNPLVFGLRNSPVNLFVVDDDTVELSNLHRQILFREADVGLKKVFALKRAMKELGKEIVAIDNRFVPETANELTKNIDLICEGSDNFATKFLVAELAIKKSIPVFQMSAVEDKATLFVATSSGKPCYHCLFEEEPTGETANCESSGVLAPLLGVVSAIACELISRYTTGKIQESEMSGQFYSVAKNGFFRNHTFRARSNCSLCKEVNR